MGVSITINPHFLLGDYYDGRISIFFDFIKLFIYYIISRALKNEEKRILVETRQDE